MIFKDSKLAHKYLDGLKRIEIGGSAHNPYNVDTIALFANSSNAEATTMSGIDLLSNGFKLYSTWNGINNSGDTTIYAAFAENPFKYANAR